MQDQDEINANAAREVLLRMLAEDKNPENIVEERGFRQVSDTDALETIVNRILTDNPSGIQDYKSGNMKVLGFFIGQAMKATQGKANPKVLNEIFIKKLSVL
jgi:aspartyl-tRNA(Asn)/glutamyl-tRNA(Gln) amidotransferase subunit B